MFIIGCVSSSLVVGVYVFSGNERSNILGTWGRVERLPVWPQWLHGGSQYRRAKSHRCRTHNPSVVVHKMGWAGNFYRAIIASVEFILCTFCVLSCVCTTRCRRQQPVSLARSLEAERNSKATSCCLTGFRLYIHLRQGGNDFACFVCLFVSSPVTATLDRSSWWQWLQVIVFVSFLSGGAKIWPWNVKVRQIFLY